jgi:hypothetical protein
MEELFLQNDTGMLGWKVVSHNDLPIEKGIWDVDKVDLRENLDHVRLIFFCSCEIPHCCEIFEKFCYKFNDFFFENLLKSEKKKSKSCLWFK